MLENYDCGYIAFIDESGDEGFKFERGSSNWFVLSGYIIKKSFYQNTIDCIGNIKNEFKWQQEKHIHWKKLHHFEKKYFCKQISHQKCTLITVCVHKPSIIEKEQFDSRYRLYFYTCRYLIERISWHIRDVYNIKSDLSNKILLIFSNRSGMSYNELKAYFSFLQLKSEVEDIRIEWQHIDFDLIKAFPPGKLEGLQLADAVAGAFYNAFEDRIPAKHETEYGQILKNKVYRHKGDFWGYGLKIVPPEMHYQVENDPKFEWLQQAYIKKVL